MKPKSPECRTAELFGSLWGELSDDQYKESVALFDRRFAANGFDLAWFTDKDCLDVGTGSGRYALAMALHGAKVTACDISEQGLAIARRRTEGLASIEFVFGSALDLPFPDRSFDFVCCAGVLHHTSSIERGLDEITRVLRPEGKCFLLLYGAGGLRWKLVAALRPLASEIGYETIEQAIDDAGLPANNRKHFLDDLFVPIQTLTPWSELSEWLRARNFSAIEYWTKARLDHEADAPAQIEDMEKLSAIFRHVDAPLGQLGFDTARLYCRLATQQKGDAGLVIGDGNHRVVATLS